MKILDTSIMLPHGFLFWTSIRLMYLEIICLIVDILSGNTSYLPFSRDMFPFDNTMREPCCLHRQMNTLTHTQNFAYHVRQIIDLENSNQRFKQTLDQLFLTKKIWLKSTKRWYIWKPSWDNWEFTLQLRIRKTRLWMEFVGLENKLYQVYII